MDGRTTTSPRPFSPSLGRFSRLLWIANLLLPTCAATRRAHSTAASMTHNTECHAPPFHDDLFYLLSAPPAGLQQNRFPRTARRVSSNQCSKCTACGGRCGRS